MVQRIRKITDRKAVELYFGGYKNLIPWVKESHKDDFESSFPFPPDAVRILRSISLKLTGTRSTISFLHTALQAAAAKKEKELIPLWRVVDDLMSYNETPSSNSSGAVSIQSAFRGEVAALSAAQSSLKRITEGHLARPQNRSRAERILNTLFLYRLANVDGGLTPAQILDAVCDPKPREEELEAQLGHYGTILEEMTTRLRNQIRKRQDRYEFVPKESSAYDDLVNSAADKLKNDPQKLWQMIDRLMMYDDPDNPFGAYVTSDEDWRRVALSIDRWHGQERSGRVTAADLTKPVTHHVEVTQGDEDDFLVVISRRDMTEKAIDSFLKKKDKDADPRIVVWAPAPLKDDEKATLAGVLAHLLVADENRGTKIETEGRKEFGNQSSRAYTVLREVYGRGTAKTCRTSVTISTVGGFDDKMAQMATEALDTCYKSREIDFGNRKFDTQGAVKLVNGLIKRGQAVSEGDQLWSAVENFAGPLGLVRPEAPARLDPEASKCYKEIRKKIEEHRSTGIDVRTVYNWFTGYDAKEGKESWGLTRRMVDMYLLAMARQGIVRISLKKRGEWIDRNNIADTDFKPDNLRNLERVELPRPLDDWGTFCPYLEVLLSRRAGSLGPVPEGSLGPMYDRPKAEESLHSLYDGNWINPDDLQYHDRDLKSLFSTLGRASENPFDDLLFYWLEFADERLPGQFDDRELFDLLRRRVMKVAGVTSAEDLTPEHLKAFKINFKRLADLKESFKKTSLVLIQAAKLASVPVPEGAAFKEIVKAQNDVKKELQKAQELVLNPDLVNTRLLPRLTQLENVYVPAYLGALEKLGDIQFEIDGLGDQIKNGGEYTALTDFAAELSEADGHLQWCARELALAPKRIRSHPENRDVAETDARRDGVVKDNAHQELNFCRLVQEIGTREAARKAIANIGMAALNNFAAFLRSPRVMDQMQAIDSPVDGVKDVLKSKSDREVAAALLAIPSPQRKAFAKQLKAAIGGKRAKSVRIGDFDPKTSVMWETGDIETVVAEFREYISEHWSEGAYLKIEK